MSRDKSAAESWMRHSCRPRTSRTRPVFTFDHSHLISSSNINNTTSFTLVSYIQSGRLTSRNPINLFATQSHTLSSGCPVVKVRASSRRNMIGSYTRNQDVSCTDKMLPQARQVERQAAKLALRQESRRSQIRLRLACRFVASIFAR